MTTAQLELLATLPVDPRSSLLVDLEPIERGRLYVAAGLDCWQIACVEEALRMALAGTYPEAAR